MSKKDLYLLDGSGYIFRAYYALPPLTRSDGLPTGAIFGFCQMLLNVLDKKPANIAVVFDSARENFRHEIYPQYKDNRGETPEDLIPQFPFFRRAAAALSLPLLEEKGFEADDVIATLATRAAAQDYNVKIYSSDKDMMQLIGGKISLIDPFKNRDVGADKVMEKFGVAPEKVADVQALMGDASDGFPGLPGIGPKTAANLINQFGNLENLLANVDKIENKRQQEIVRGHIKEAKIFHQLALLRRDAPLQLNPDQLPAPLDADPAQQLAALQFFEELEFHKLAQKWRNKFNLGGGDVAPATTAKTTASKNKKTEAVAASDGGGNNLPHGNNLTQPHLPAKQPSDFTPTMVDEKNLPAVLAAIEKFGRVGFVLLDNYLAMGLENGEAFLLPLAPPPNNATTTDNNDLFVGNKQANDHAGQPMPQEIKAMFGNDAINKFNHEAVSTSIALHRHGAGVDYVTDVSVLHFCLFAGAKNDDMSDIDQDYLEKFIKDLAKEAAKEKNADGIALQQQLCFMAYQLVRLGIFYEQKLAANKMTRVYQQIERPLLPRLAAMEEVGIAIDVEKFTALGKQTDEKIANLEKKIFDNLGQEFNLSSPKQLGEVLFNVKKIGGDKMAKTKTGQFSTSSEVLEALQDEHPVIADILYHRHLEKLNNTYIRSLPLLARRDKNGQARLHTHFSSTNAQTGRLSSLNPNLQNIPIRTADGVALRECFIASRGKLLLSLDYSQIELRVLALLSSAPALKKAFLRGDDIHASTAAEIFDLPIEKVTPEVRRRAKAVNFGIIYGISAFGLSRQLQIPQAEAKDIIKRYFEKLPGIKEFMDHVIATTEKNHFVETLFGRRIYLPAITSKGPAKAYAIRQAMNAPLQGTAADIIKRAMIKIDRYLADNKLQPHCQMILQIHDELLFEVDEDKATQIEPVLREMMSEVSLLGFDKRHWPSYGPTNDKIDWRGQEQDFLLFPVAGGVGKNWRLAH
ncbi:MAG: DNA polymerase I [Hydrotalea sp.]|nr:DNA polymerase I [Hydrotalea sp.]